MQVDTFVGAEYIIANALITLKRKGKDYILISDLREIGRQFQVYCNENDIPAVILTSGSHVERALFEFSEYFDYIEPICPKRNPVICIKKGVSVSSLQQRFCGYLPLDVIFPLITKLPGIVNNCVKE